MTDNFVSDNKKQIWIIISVAFAAFVSTLDGFIVNISLPSISHYFNVSTSEVSRVSLFYLLTLTSVMLMSGKLADTIGLKRVYIGGFVIFTFGSLLCGLSPTLDLLVASRCIQAIGGSVLFSIGFAIITQYIPIEKRAKALSIISTVAALGITVGAPLGGFLTGYFSWHWIFLVNIIPGIVAVIVSQKNIPADKEIKSLKGFDILGGALIFLTLSFLIYALNVGQEAGWTSLKIISCFIASIIFFIVFMWRELSVNDPLLDLNLFKDKDFSFANLSNSMAFLFFSGYNFLMPFYLILIKKLEVQKAGLILVTYSIVFMLVSSFIGKLSDKFSSKSLCTMGLISITGAICYFAFTLGENGLLATIIFLVWLGVSFGLFISPNNNLVMTLAPRDKSGIASSVFKTTSNLSLVLGVCIFETIFSSFIPQHYSTLDNGNLLKAGVPENFLLLGFKNAFLVGAIVCVVAVAFNLLVKAPKNNILDNSNEEPLEKVS